MERLIVTAQSHSELLKASDYLMKHNYNVQILDDESDDFENSFNSALSREEFVKEVMVDLSQHFDKDGNKIHLKE